jgi:hypothetical protein
MPDAPHATPDRRWRDDIDALAFRPRGHAGLCLVHRLAFRSLLRREPVPADCLGYFDARRAAFEKAAADKIARRELPPDANFHLNSRDVQRGQ